MLCRLGPPRKAVQVGAATWEGVVHVGIKLTNSAWRDVSCVFAMCWSLQTAIPE